MDELSKISCEDYRNVSMCSAMFWPDCLSVVTGCWLNLHQHLLPYMQIATASLLLGLSCGIAVVTAFCLCNGQQHKSLHRQVSVC